MVKPHKSARDSCLHCKQKDHDHDKHGDTCRFHEHGEGGKCVYYKTHKKPRLPKYYSKCVTPTLLSKVHKKR